MAMLDPSKCVLVTVYLVIEKISLFSEADGC